MRALAAHYERVRAHNPEDVLLIVFDLPQHVQFVWSGIDNESELQRFLASEVRYAECTVRRHPVNNTLYARQASFPLAGGSAHERTLRLSRLLEALHKRRRRLRLDLSAEPQLLDATLELLHEQALATADIGLPRPWTGCTQADSNGFPINSRMRLLSVEPTSWLH